MRDPLPTARPASRDRLGIAIVTETYPPEINGVAHTMRHLAEGLASRGHRVETVRPRQPADADVGVSATHPELASRARPGASTEAGQSAPEIAHLLVPGLPIPGYGDLRFGLPVYWRLRHRWRRSAPDILYIATQGPLGRAALRAARALGIPAVTGFHTQFHRYAERYGLGLLARPILDSLRRFHNRSDATLVPTEELCADLSAAGFERVSVFGRGVDIERFSPAWRDPALRRRWGCAADSLAVLHVGRIAAEKNLELAVAAFRAIQVQRPEARFILVGDGPELPRLRRRAPDLIQAGALVGQELAAHYASADLFLFPSLTETFGNVVIEAMASGLPVVAFDYAAAQRYIESGTSGVRVPVGDASAFVAAAAAAARDEAGRRRMGEAARRIAGGLDWRLALDRVEQSLLTTVSRAAGATTDDSGFQTARPAASRPNRASTAAASGVSATSPSRASTDAPADARASAFDRR